MKKKMNVILSLVLMVCMIFGLTAPAYVARADTMLNCPITVTEDYDEANELFQLINQERINRGLDPFVYDTGVADYAMQRAAEQSIFWGHYRPNGQQAQYGENVAAGYGGASLTFKKWMDSSGHRALILRESMIGGDPIQYAGVGVVRYNGSDYWVLNVADDPVSGNTMQSSGKATTHRTFDLNVSKYGHRMRFFRRQRSLFFNQKEDPNDWQRQWVIMGDRNDGVSAFTGYSIPLNMINIQVEDSSILDVNPSTGVFITKKVGQTNVTVSLKDYPQVSTTIPISVKAQGGTLQESDGTIRKFSQTFPDGSKANEYGGSDYAVEYTGKPHTPKITIRDWYGVTMVDGRDYRLEYKDNVQPGTAQIKLYHMGNYSNNGGEVYFNTLYFTIKEAPKPTQPPVKPTEPPVKPTQTPVKPTQTPQKPSKPTQAPTRPTNVTPGTVNSVKAVPVSYNGIEVQWNKVSNATHYKVYYKKAGAKRWATLATVRGNASQYTHKSSKKFPIAVGQKYTYTVRAYNSAYQTYGKYNTAGVTTRTKPDTVKIKRAKLARSKKSVTVTWNKAKGCNYYSVYRKTPSTGWKRIANIKSKYASYIDKKPIKGQKNIYAIRGYYSNTKMLGNYSKPVSVTMPSVTPGKVKVTGVSLKSGRKVQVRWKKASNATHYKIYYKQAGTKKWKCLATVKGNKTSYIHRSSSKNPLKAKKKYVYTVRSYNSSSKKLGKYDTRGKTVYIKK